MMFTLFENGVLYIRFLDFGTILENIPSIMNEYGRRPYWDRRLFVIAGYDLFSLPLLLHHE
jgi:hypothetical protein